MANTDLGFTPNKARLILSEGADFKLTLQEGGTVWPASTTCRIEFPDLTGIGPYSATVTISTATAVFDIDKTATTGALIPSGSHFRIYLVKGTTDDFLWFEGAVKRVE